MRILRTILLAAFAAAGCQQKPFVQVKVDNPPVRLNTVFKSYEDLSLPKFQALREKYQIDTIFDGGENEFERVLLLRDWIRKVISIDNSGGYYPGKGETEAILDAAMKGQGFHCGHYMIVQNAVLNAYGFVARCVGAGEGVPDALEGHHGVNEVWINTLNKWVMVDAKYNNHFEEDGIPLSALEIRDAWLKNKAADIQLMKGPERTPIQYDGDVSNRTREQYARIYTWLEWETYNNRYSAWPEVQSHVNHYEDNYFKEHVWLWGSKPHWAYGTEYMVLVKDRGAIEWTPNTLRARVVIEGSSARIFLETETTPNFKTFQMRQLPASEWQNIPEAVDVSLKKGKNVMDFRSINLAHVAGPVHRVVIEN